MIRSDLKGKVCLITGGASGIGLATADALAQLGASVCILDLNSDAAHAAAESLSSRHGIAALGAKASVDNEEQVQEAVTQCCRTLGEVDVLVNNAGILPPNLVNFSDIALADIEEMLRVHVMGTCTVTRALINTMVQRGFGRVINLSSVSGVLGAPRRIGYSTAKHAIVGFTRTLALEVARYGVTVNAVAPAYVLTQTVKKRIDAGLLDYERYAQRTPAGRWALPEEVANAIAFLALPASGFITGAVLPVDGGYTIYGDPDPDARPVQSIQDLEALRSVFPSSAYQY